MTEPADELATWKSRFDASRRRREQYETIWALYARMHTNGYRAVADNNDDALVTFPTGDQVKASLVFRNVEQTLALLEVPEIGVRATATDYTHALGALDTHRESVVEQALYRSLMRSGLIQDSEETDPIKRDGTLIGHGINYTHWRVVEDQVERPPLPVLIAGPDGQLTAALDEQGAPMHEAVTEQRVIFEGCQDEHVSPLQFLCDAGAKRFEKAGWHGFERPVALAALKQDPRYRIPEDVVGTDFRVKDIYGNEGSEDELVKDAVMVIVAWDIIGRTLLTFIETAPASAAGSYAAATRKASAALQRDTSLIEIGRARWPLTFSHPDASPFSFYVPIPAQDHPFGISQVEHVRVQALEADKLRTRQANITRQIKRIPWFNKKRVDIDQLRQAFRSADVEPVGLDIQESEKPEQLFGELPVPNIHPDIYRQYTVAEQGVDKTTGVSDVPGGGADTATEAEHIFDIGGARTRRKKRRYLSFLSTVGRRHFDYLREWSPEGETIIVPDVDGRPLTLAYGRAAFAGEFLVEVIAGGGAMSLSPVKQKLMIEASGQLMGKFGPAFDRVYLRQLLTMFDFRDVNELMRAAAAAPGAPELAGSAPRPGYSPDEYRTAQTIRAGINAPNE